MKLHTFADAVTAIDDRYIAEAAEAEALQTKQRTRIFHRKWTVVPIAAALLAMAMFVVNAAAPVDLGFYLAAAFGDSYEMLDEMTSMPEPVAYRSSGEEIKLEMKGLVGDRQVVNVFVGFPARNTVRSWICPTRAYRGRRILLPTEPRLVSLGKHRTPTARRRMPVCCLCTLMTVSWPANMS